VAERLLRLLAVGSFLVQTHRVLVPKPHDAARKDSGLARDFTG
jgi:hypothetical protein